MKSIFILAIGISIFSIPSFAQSDILTSKYIFNPMFFNPANTGMNDETELTYLMKSGLRFNSPEIPNKEILSVGIPIKGQRWSVGVSAMHQDFFLTNYLMLKPSAAYRIGFNDGKSILSIGLAPSFTKFRVDEIFLNNLVPEQNKYYLNADLGVFYKNSFGYLGLAGRDLINTSINVKDVDGNEILLFTRDKYLALSGGINCFRFGQGLLVIRPSFSLTNVISGQFSGATTTRSELNLEIELYNQFNFGASYRDTGIRSSFFFEEKFIDVWLGYKDHEKKLMLVTNWNIEQSIFLNRFTAELMFVYRFTYNESPVMMEYHFF